ncbi:hypothetical protein [Streptomyces sp. B6B3]|uniref:hypothetical protein n=1 Tax=Streptomyces sp. B6B3 TaxID=3153570 RepID=UPI00325E9434
MKRTPLAVATSLVVLAGTASAAWAAPASTQVAPNAPAAGCWELAEQLHYPTSDHPRWTYTHRVEWCGDGTSVTWWETPDPDIQVADDTCASEGVKERRETPGDPGWEMFSMGGLSCQDGAEPYQLNPWVTVTVYPDGEYEVRKAIAGSPYE